MNGVNGAGKKELRENDEREYLICAPLGAKIGKHENAECAAEKTGNNNGGDECKQCSSGKWHSQNESENNNADGLAERDKRFAKDFSENNGVTRDRRYKYRLAEIVFPVFD